MRSPRLCRAAVAGLVLLAFAACESTSTAPAPSSSATKPTATPLGTSPRPRATQEPAWISFERTRTDSGAAPGPVYVVTLYDDGKVIFEGHAQVKRKGTFSRSLPRDAASRLFAQIETMNLWDRPRRYDVERANRGGDEIIVRSASTEVPWDIVRAKRQGRLLRIDGLFFAPADLLAFKQDFEQTVGLAEFIGEPHEWQR